MLVLNTESAESAIFRLRTGGHNWQDRQDILSRQIVHLDVHTGGTWELESRVPGNAQWVGTSRTFTDIGQKAFWASTEFEYRLAGGTIGAQAYVTGVAGVA